MTDRMGVTYHEPKFITRARRFVRRARARDVQIGEIEWSVIDSTVYIQIGRRVVHVDRTGHATQAGAYRDPQWRAKHNGLHAFYLKVAGNARRAGRKESALRALGICASDRAEGTPLPA